jgi:hypothetical protein
VAPPSPWLHSGLQTGIWLTVSILPEPLDRCCPLITVCVDPNVVSWIRGSHKPYLAPHVKPEKIWSEMVCECVRPALLLNSFRSWLIAATSKHLGENSDVSNQSQTSTWARHRHFSFSIRVPEAKQAHHITYRCPKAKSARLKASESRASETRGKPLRLWPVSFPCFLLFPYSLEGLKAVETR